MDTTKVLLSNKFSNADGAVDYGKLAESSASLVSQLSANRAAQTAANGGCKKPLLNIGKKKKEYEDCLAEKKKEKEALAKREAELIQLQRESLISPSRTTEKKVLGMPKEIGIPVVILGSASILFIGYKILTRNK
jgi:hypothetical protein